MFGNTEANVLHEEEREHRRSIIAVIRTRMADASRIVQQRVDFRNLNINAARTRMHFNPNGLDASVKKNLALVKNLRMITANNHLSIAKAIQETNMTHFVSEAVNAVVDSKLKSSDIAAAVDIISLLHLRYSDFTRLLIPKLSQAFSLPSREAAASETLTNSRERISRRRTTLRLLTELLIAGVHSDPAPLIAAVAQEAALANFIGGEALLSFVADFRCYAGEDLLGLVPPWREATQAFLNHYLAHPPAATAAGEAERAAQEREEVTRLEKALKEGQWGVGGLGRESRRALHGALMGGNKVPTAELAGLVCEARKGRRQPAARGGPSNGAVCPARAQRSAAVKGKGRAGLKGKSGGCRRGPEPDSQSEQRLPVLRLYRWLNVRKGKGRKGRKGRRGLGACKGKWRKIRKWQKSHGYKSFGKKWGGRKGTLQGGRGGGRGVRRKAAVRPLRPERREEVLKADGSRRRGGGDKGSDLLFEDEDEREFYQRLPSLHDLLPAALLARSHGARGRSAAEGGGVAEARDQVKETERRARLEALLARLPECHSLELIDQAALEFCFINTPATRNKLARALFAVPCNCLSLLPCYARLSAALAPAMPEVGVQVADLLQGAFHNYMQNKTRSSLQSKIKAVRFLGELFKFGLTRPPVIFRCFQMCLDDFTHQNIEVACNLLEVCGRFLYRKTTTHNRMHNMLEQLKNIEILDSRLNTMVEKAYNLRYANFPSQLPPTQR